MKPLSTEYRQALADHDAAIAAYTPVRDRYRAGEISDAEYLAARKVYYEATAAFDAAYAKEGR